MPAPGLPPSTWFDALDFEQAYDDNLARVFAFFAYRLTSRDDAEDLTQQTFERALKAWDRFDPRRAAPSTWLIAIARNLLIDHHRTRASSGSSQPLDSVEPGALPKAEAAYAGLGLGPELARALDTLTQRDRELLALRYGADLTGPEIAEMTGLTLANVQQIISRSLRRLRLVLEGGQAGASVPEGEEAAADSSSPQEQSPVGQDQPARG